jgi:hypothetical protein
MDKIIDKIVALGIPGLVLFIAISVSGAAGAAGIVSALAFLGGPFGMLGGIVALGIITLFSKALAEYGFEAIFTEVIRRFEAQGKSKDEIINTINSYPISRELKEKIINKIRCS